MDRRIMFVVLGIAALALAGLAFAAGGQGWNATGLSQQNWDGTAQGHKIMRGGPGNVNETGCGMMRRGEGNGTFAQAGAPRFNSTEQKAFKAAIESGDFAAATKLHEEYGFGGKMFEKLNATTFVKFSQIANLESQLETELGMNATGMMPPLLNRPGFGMRPGVQGGRGMMEPEFAKGMRHGFDENTNQTTQE